MFIQRHELAPLTGAAITGHRRPPYLFLSRSGSPDCCRSLLSWVKYDRNHFAAGRQACRFQHYRLLPWHSWDVGRPGEPPYLEWHAKDPSVDAVLDEFDIADEIEERLLAMLYHYQRESRAEAAIERAEERRYAYT